VLNQSVNISTITQMCLSSTFIPGPKYNYGNYYAYDN